MFGAIKIVRVYHPSRLLILHRDIHKSKNKIRSIDSDAFVTVRVTPSDHSRILSFFWENYNREEPTLVAAGLAKKRNSVLDNKLLSFLHQGVSLMVLCRSSGELAGCAVNSVVCEWDPDYCEDEAKNCLCPDTSQLMKFYAYVSRAPNLFSKYQINKIFETTYLTTRADDKFRGVGKELMKMSRDLARDLGYALFKVDCTSQYSAIICEKLGMVKVFELPYAKYLGPDGKQLYYPPPPHLAVKVYVDYLRNPDFSRPTN